MSLKFSRISFLVNSASLIALLYYGLRAVFALEDATKTYKTMKFVNTKKLIITNFLFIFNDGSQ